MNLSNLTTRNIGLDIGLYLRIPKWLLRRPNEKGVCLCKQETCVDAWEDTSRTIVIIISYQEVSGTASDGIIRRDRFQL